jgi:heptaprenyl diphosphate synthase
MIDSQDKDNGAAQLSFDAAFASVKDEIRRILSGSPLIVREYMQHLLGAQGKYIRAASLLTCAQSDGDLIAPDAVKLAAATEILHLATLVHDDIIDNADVRRGIPTLQKKFGQKTAVICGDYLLSVALRTAAAIPFKQDYLRTEFPNYIAQICFGELSQHVNNGNLDLTEFDYLRIISGKTAALFESSFYAGAVLCGCSEDDMKQYKRLGWYAGMIFQLTDDCNDFETPESTAKKSVRSDFEQNVITLPLIAAMRNSDVLKAKVAAGGITQAQLCQGVAEGGGLAYTRSLADRYYARSLMILDRLTLSDDKRERLISILKTAMQFRS